MNLDMHEKIMECCQAMQVDLIINLPYYGNFMLFVNFHERKEIETCQVNVTQKGMNFYYNPTFFDSKTQKEVNFIVLHEIFHLLWDHPKRTITGQYNGDLASVVQDMIINHIVWEDIDRTFIDLPKDKNGRNMTLFVPIEYKGELVFELLYEWIREEKEKHEARRENDSTVGPEYGYFGRRPGRNSVSRGETNSIQTHSLEYIFDNFDNNHGEYLDTHGGDEVPEELRDVIVKEVMERLSARGYETGNISESINKLRKKKKDYLTYIKRSLSSLIFGTKKYKTITRLNRRGIFGLKGNKKLKTIINVILDTSGSMGGTFERVLSFIYRNDIETNLIEADTNVKWIQRIKSKRQLQSLPIKGLGGTILQPAVDLVQDKFNDCNTLILTDGYCDNLNLSKIKGNVLLISVGVKVPIAKTNGRIKQIVIGKTE